MANAMRYRLALDLGSTSLGWAMLRLNSQNEVCALIRGGVRIFSDGRDPKTAASLAVTRRNARGMRRRRDRLLKRKNKLVEALIALGFFPADKAQCKQLELLNPYQLRAEGLTRPLSGAEFARALFHINQRRGFLSNRRTDQKESDASVMKNAIKALHQEIDAENCQTLGQWLYRRQQAKKSVRARLHNPGKKDSRYDFYADRALTAQEFDALWDKQSEGNPSLFNDVAREQLRSILLFQRNLLPVRAGRCTLLPEEERAALALPSTQRFRIYQELANLRFLDAQLQETPLSLAQRDTLAQALERATLSFTAIRKTLGLPGTTKFNLEDAKRDRLKGNATSMIMAKSEHFGDAWHAFTLAQQDEIVSQLLEEADEGKLLAWLQNTTKVDEPRADKIANAKLATGYGNLSRAALARILPELMASIITYDKAVVAAGFDSHSALSRALQTGEQMPELPYYGEVLKRHVGFAKDKPRNDEERFGKIANPTVHIGLNQVRLVVNSLIKRYGHPTQVVIEVARELKLSRERQQEMEREQATNQKRNEDLLQQACLILKTAPAQLSKAQRRQISQKMQLWQQLNLADPYDRCCPYSGEKISIERLLSDEVQIEHILPYARTLDDGMMNKTVALHRANKEKGNLTPWEAFGEHPRSGYDYDAIWQRAHMLPAAKRKRFAKDAYQIWLKDDKDFLARALNDTAYLSRIAVEYLSCICPAHGAVLAIPGKMTAMIRGKFGLNELLSGDSSKNREDHRHHLLDAIVIGLNDRSQLQKFATANSHARAQALDRLLDRIEQPWPSFREQVAHVLQSAYVSHKPDHGYQGAFMEDTAWGLLPAGQVRRHIVDAASGKRELTIKKLDVIPIADAKQIARHGVDANGAPKAYKGYLGGSNYCIEISRNQKGAWEGEIISTFDAYQVIRALGEHAGFQRLRDPEKTQSGKPLVMRLCKKDYLRLELDGKLRTMLIAKISANGQIFMADHNEANAAARDQDKNNPFNYVSKRPGSLQKAKGRRCTITPDGRLHDPGFKG